MNILFATSEAAPFCKTGGLGDVCGALPRELARLGHRPVVILPAFRQTQQAGMPLEQTGVRVEVPIGQKLVQGHFLRSYLPDSDVPVYLVDQPDYYDRPQLYRDDGEDYKDNCERFTFFCRAALEAIPLLGLDVDVVHCHDWCAGLIPAFLKTMWDQRPPLDQLVSVLTIHNLAYQGNFWHWDMALTGLDWKYFNWRQMEFYGNLSFLKTGIVFADMLTTVSPTYAREILSSPLGCGLEGALQHRSADMAGIINGVDYHEWDPAIDRYLGANRYTEKTLPTGKAACKADLQRRFGLPQRPDVPLVAAVGRLVDQKGFDLITRVMKQWAAQVDAQWVILGTGEPRYHEALSSLAAEHPQKIGVRLEFSDELAHRIEAGADMFLMPSQYEPCGLNQLYSLKYGTVPVVRATGGLVDTVVDATEQTLVSRTATGFAFSDYTTLALAETLDRARRAYANPAIWKQLVETGMRQDWSWRQSAEKYVELYEHTLARAPLGVGSGILTGDAPALMPELRIDPITGRRVYVAEDRAGRPFDYVEPSPARRASQAAECPFCAGHEALTPDASAEAFDAEGRWQVRVVPNKFPAIALDSPTALGAHEVIVEAPQHLLDFDQLEVDQLAGVLQVYQQRLRHWASDGRLQHALIFKNSGFAAGASLEHVHSQLLAAPYVHEAVQTELVAAQRHFVAERRCLFCDLVRAEIAARDRVVLHEGGFVAICAYAGRQPYETWILPEDHAAHFESMSEDQARTLAGVLPSVLAKVKQTSGQSAYNLVLHSAPFGSMYNDCYHWHWELMPRITQFAGLELGGGGYINPVSPERAARNLREVSPHVPGPSAR